MEVEYHPCRLHTYDTLPQQIRAGGEVLLVIGSIIYLAIAVREYTFLGWKIFLQNMVLCPSRVIFLFGRILLVLAVPFRFACQPIVEDRLAILVMITTGPYCLFFCRYLSYIFIRIVFIRMIFKSFSEDSRPLDHLLL